MKTKCAKCYTSVERKPSYIKANKNTFCSRECRIAFQTTSIVVKCGYCGKEVTKTLSAAKKHNANYCSISCSTSANNTKYKSGANHVLYNGSNYRKIAFDAYSKKCNRCEYSKYESVLQVHHIDHDRKNNSIENLEILCPTCHMVEHIEIHNGTMKKP